MLNLIPYVLLLPALGFVALGLAGRALPHRLIAIMGCGTVLVAFALAVVNFASLLRTPVAGRSSYVVLWTWLTSGRLTIGVDLLYDPLTAVMLLVVTGVGFLIHLYSVGYMEGDPGYWRYFSYLNLFVFAMALLVAAGNFLFLLIGWAGVGLASFLLIGFWYTRPSAVAAAKKAFVVNVIGDLGLTIAIFLLFNRFGTLAYQYTLAPSAAQVFAINGPEIIAITLLLFVAAAAKSAQFPLHVWLPDAMEGPTPVSALIHAATMVTAGVYLVARAAPLFDRAPAALAVVGGIGGFTALFAATVACVQHDIKRVLAYSTMSQLGYMFMGEGAGGYTAGIFHLTTHAYFKALLFMAAGAVIHALGGEQDMRRMGGLRARLPYTFWCLVAGGLALAAIVPFSGFWSKDAVLGAVLARAQTGGGGWYLLYAVGLLTAALTGFYIFRLIFVVFWGRSRAGEAGVSTSHGPSASGEHGAALHVPGWVMTVPMGVLALLSLVGGFVNVPWNEALGTLLTPVVGAPFNLEPGSPAFYLSLVASLACALAGIGVAWMRYGAREYRVVPERGVLYQFLARGWYFDDLDDRVFVRPFIWFGQLAARVIEGLTLDGGSRGVGWTTARLSAGLRTLQTGYVRNYALAILLGAVVMLVYYLVRLGMGG